MYSSKIRQVGSSSGILLSRELMAELGVQQGDTVYFTKGPEGSFRLSALDTQFAEEMEAAESLLRSHRDAFKALASR